MMNIDNLQAYYSAYIEGELSTEDRKKFEAALDKNPDARQTVERMQLVCEYMQQMPVMSASPGFENRLHQRINQRQSRTFLTIPFPEFSNWKSTAIAAAVVLVVSVSSLVWYSPGEGENPPVNSTTSSSISPMAQPSKPSSELNTSLKQGAALSKPPLEDPSTKLSTAEDDSTDREQIRNLRNNIQVVKDKGN